MGEKQLLAAVHVEIDGDADVRAGALGVGEASLSEVRMQDAVAGRERTAHVSNHAGVRPIRAGSSIELVEERLIECAGAPTVSTHPCGAIDEGGGNVGEERTGQPRRVAAASAISPPSGAAPLKICFTDERS